MRFLAAVTALALAAMTPVHAHESAEQPVLFRGSATAVSSMLGDAGETGRQEHDHPFSASSPRGPFVVPGVIEVRAAVGRTRAARPFAARTQTSVAEASEIAILPGTPFEVRATLARGQAVAGCTGGAVSTQTRATVTGLAIGGMSFTGRADPDGVLVDTPALRVVAKEETAIPDGVAITALHVTVAGIGDVLLGHAEASVPFCVPDEAWGRAPVAAVALDSAGPSSGEGTFFGSLPCAQAAHGESHHFDYTSATQAADAAPSSDAVAGRLDAFLDMHLSDVLGPQRQNAFLLGSESRVVLSNERGSITAELESGSCKEPTLLATSSSVGGDGTWRIVDATGSFREARGVGTFSFSATVGPGTDNPLTLALAGNVSVLTPRLVFETRDATRTAQGLAGGRTAVVLAVGNAGPGDAFAVRVADAHSTSAGVGLVAPALPLSLPDLEVGEDVASTLRFGLEPLACDPLGCTYAFAARAETLTALNQPVVITTTETVEAPGGPS